MLKHTLIPFAIFALAACGGKKNSNNNSPAPNPYGLYGNGGYGGYGAGYGGGYGLNQFSVDDQPTMVVIPQSAMPTTLSTSVQPYYAENTRLVERINTYGQPQANWGDSLLRQYFGLINRLERNERYLYNNDGWYRDRYRTYGHYNVIRHRRAMFPQYRVW